MIFPLSWTWLRPGWLIPVFFLLPYGIGLSAQLSWPETASAALGGAYVTRSGISCAWLNQAGLGGIEQNSLSFQHSRPYLLKDLGQSSLSGQFRTHHGSLGAAFSTQGIKGLRQSALWISYGLRLFSNVRAGLGIHFWNSSMAEKWMYDYGISFALGIQARIFPSWVLGIHVSNPLSWSSHPHPKAFKGMSLAAGFSYTFLKSAVIYAEIQAHSSYGVSLVQAIQWPLSKRINLRMGCSSKPLTFGWGISFLKTPWNLQFAFQYRTLSGSVPLSTLSHVW